MAVSDFRVRLVGVEQRSINPILRSTKSFSIVERGDGWKWEQGDSGRQSRQGSGDQANPGWPADRQSERGDVRNLARQGDRRTQGKDRVASRRDFQRGSLQ